MTVTISIFDEHACLLAKALNVFLASQMDFGLNLLRWAAINESLVLSPASIIFALTVIQAGANCKTKAQLNSVLCKGASDLEIHHHYSKLAMNISEARHGVQSMIANGFFMEYVLAIFGYLNLLPSSKKPSKHFTIINEYRELIEKNYNAKVEACDFQSPHRAAKVVYMRIREAQRLYAENEDMKVLSLQYKDANYAFSILLPKKRFGLDALRNKLSGEKILKILAELKLANVSIESNFMLKPALISMNVTEIFTKNADLTGTVRPPHLYISDANHRAIIEMDEESTTAAAATNSKVSYKSLKSELKAFLANHPFIFVVTMSSHPLFMGQFT
ncbi:unnamed protein product [Angiostrongylus costaricensis]|uniref:SERPIN domain-containing protein n=1 Tax=Angiostrongylus costaricensis TaxID=334426 RepID=A0A158PIY3_ANGCS|nr:unnamed protein product [Angiostrongylus costaricensis]